MVGRVKKMWNDSVWSKVIAVGILGMIGVVYSYFQVLWPVIGRWFVSESKIPNWLLVVSCLVFLLSIFVCFRFRFRYKREKMNLSSLELDRSVYKKVKNILPWDGAINFIYEHDFYSNFDRDRLTDLYNYCSECRDPHFYFIDLVLEKIRKDLLGKIDQFLEVIHKKTYPIENSNHSEIPWEWKRDRPEDFKQAVEKLNEFSKQIWECYESIVKMGRKKLNVDESFQYRWCDIKDIVITSQLCMATTPIVRPPMRLQSITPCSLS